MNVISSNLQDLNIFGGDRDEMREQKIFTGKKAAILGTL